MPSSRTESFQGGMLGSPEMYPTGVANNSVLMPYSKSPIALNAGSDEAKQRMNLTGTYPSQDSYSPDTYTRKFIGINTQVGS